ncbi:MAG TPA: hypothetical protein DDW52_11710 [Planctomycetaceae bacterium]|nr:hypothetical protein [Planctomycetaceae bacterium]
MGAPVGQAGNGTAMRTAALGLWFGEDRQKLVSTVTEISRLTHQDPRSVAGGVAIALAANILSRDCRIGAVSFCNVVADAISGISPELSGLIRLLPDRMKTSDCLQFIATAGQASAEFASPIITPFVLPTVLASPHCILQHRDSWIDAVATAVSLGGDVDTLGAIVGALAGAILGVGGIPSNLLAEVQDLELIQVLATRYHTLIEQQSTGSPSQ